MSVNEEMFIEDAIRIAKVICLRETGTERAAIQMLIDEAERHMDSTSKKRNVNAYIRIRICAGSSIDDAYNDCSDVSFRLGGIYVETDFNGVKMFYHHQSLKDWEEEYYKEIFGKSKGGEE